MSGITKRFPGVLANTDVNFELRRGEVHALLGENGAGKSTLCHILTGVYRPDRGEIHIDGELAQLDSPVDAIKRGVGMVHQHFRLVSTLSVAENIEIGRRGRFDLAAAEDRIAKLGEQVGLPIDPSARIWQLSVGQQQRVEILKALDGDAHVLILDEPTAVLTPAEAVSLFASLRLLTANGVSVVFISHKLDEVMQFSDRVTVMRDGTSIGTVETSSASEGELARMMVGRNVALAAEQRQGRGGEPAGEVVLEVEGLCAINDRGLVALRDMSVTVHAGEVLGIVGVAGNGQREFAEVLAGVRPRTAGLVRIAGHQLGHGGAREALAAGLAYVPEDRLSSGLAPSLSIEDNLVLKSYRRQPFSIRGFLRRMAIRTHAQRVVDDYSIKTPTTGTSTRLLSGGNVQKVLLAREIELCPKVLVAASPTRGLDVGAIENVRALLLSARDQGMALVLITEDLEEALALCDRLVVMNEGAITGTFELDQFDREQIGLAMGGARARTS